MFWKVTTMLLAAAIAAGTARSQPRPHSGLRGPTPLNERARRRR